MVSIDVINKTPLIQPLVVMKKRGEMIKRDLMAKSSGLLKYLNCELLSI